MSNKNEPADKIRFGAIQVSIWRNETSDGKVFFSGAPSRSYKNSDGEWKESVSFTGAEMLLASQALEVAFQRCMEMREEERNKTLRNA